MADAIAAKSQPIVAMAKEAVNVAYESEPRRGLALRASAVLGHLRDRGPARGDGGLPRSARPSSSPLSLPDAAAPISSD